MALTPEKPVAFPLYLRIPSWCAAPQIEINGHQVEAEVAAGKKKFVRINQTWSKGDTVTLHLPMHVSIVRGCEGPYPRQLRGYFHQIPASLFRPRVLPYASVDYGPLLFCLPIPEKDNNTPVPGAKYGYALDLNPAGAAKVKVIRTPMPAHWDWPYSAPIKLAVPMRPFDWNPTLAQDLPNSPIAGDKSETIPLVPYGCTKFHISMFPVTPRAWEGGTLPVIAPSEPELLGNADYYDDPAAKKGQAIGYIDAPGSAIVWHKLQAGNRLKIRYAALQQARLTLRINDESPQKVSFAATSKWQGDGAYAEVTVPVKVPPHATVRLMFEPGDVPANIESVEVTK